MDVLDLSDNIVYDVNKFNYRELRRTDYTKKMQDYISSSYQYLKKALR
jgi:hypothetical protein